MRVLVLTNMYPTPDNPAFGTFVAREVEALRDCGVEIDVLFINGRKTTFNYLWGIFRLWQLLLKNSYDLIHAHYTFSGIIARMQWRCPVVITYRGSELHVGQTHWLFILSKLLKYTVQRTIVVSEPMKNRLRDESAYVIPSPVNFEKVYPTDRKEARQQLNLPLDKPLVLWAGEHWVPVKRVYIVKAAMEIVKQTCPEAELIILSGQPHAVVPVYMSACDVLVLTSAHEGSPNVIKEAMACNLPIVSVDVGDVARVIEGVDGCYLVEPTPEDVAAHLLIILRSPRRTRGREKIGYLSSDIISRQIIGIYNELCEPKRRIRLESG